MKIYGTHSLSRANFIAVIFQKKKGKIEIKKENSQNVAKFPSSAVVFTAGEFQSIKMMNFDFYLGENVLCKYNKKESNPSAAYIMMGLLTKRK